MWKIINSRFSALNVIKLWPKMTLTSTHFECRRATFLGPNELDSIKDVGDFIRFDRTLNAPKKEDFEHLIDSHLTRAKIELICAEYDYLAHTTMRIPSTFTSDEMKILLKMDYFQRQLYFSRLFEREAHKMKNKIMKSVKRTQKIKLKPLSKTRTGIFDDKNNIIYGLWHNSLCTRVPSTSKSLMRKYSYALRFGQNLVIDCDPVYETILTPSEIKKLTTQQQHLYADNKNQYEDPFNLHFCNINQESLIYKYSLMPFNLSSSNFCANLTQKSYTEMFPKEKLVFITQHADECLEEYDRDAVYIISAHAERVGEKSKQVLLNKLNSEGIKFVKIPLEKYVHLRRSYTYVCTNHLGKILHDVKNGSDWKTAFEKHLPAKSIKSPKELEYEATEKFIKSKGEEFDLIELTTNLKKLE